jgi:tetratricopeptide (TPR) repeat protein
MTAEHVPDDLLIAYADDPASHPEIESHLAACSDCSSALSFYRTLNAELREEEVWSHEEELRTESGQKAVREFTERIATEDAEARRLLDRILDSPYRFARANILGRKRFRSGGVVRRLCEAVREECNREPLYAMELAQAAQSIASGLPDDYYPSLLVHELRGRAWKEYAGACRYLGRYRPALDALVRAERNYLRLADSGPGMAAVNLSRAIVLWKLQKYEEALPFVRSAAGEYEQRRDMLRYVESKEVEAVVLERMGEHLKAREIYERAFDAADDLENLEMKARAARNLGVSYRDAGDLGNSAKYLLIAMQLYEELRQDVSVARTRWSIARLPLVAGNFPEAERRLRVALRDLDAKGLQNDVADAKLDLAETLLMTGGLNEVQMLCAEVALFYREAGLVTGALTAATFLKEAASKRLLRQEHIKVVRNYLLAVREDPELPFAPPPL